MEAYNEDLRCKDKKEYTIDITYVTYMGKVRTAKSCSKRIFSNFVNLTDWY